MKTDNLNEKQTILNKLVNSGINIIPSILDFILKLENPQKKVNIIIKETSFIPTFKSHITENILRKISDEEIQKAIKRNLIKKELSSVEKCSNNIDKSSNKLMSTINSLEIEEKKPLNLEKPEKPLKKQSSIKSKTDFSQVVINVNKPTEKLVKNKLKIIPTRSIKSAFSFTPKAKEYSFNYEILKDPTGKLYTNGKYDDFYEMTLDKFNRLRKLMRKRPEVLSANNINNLLRLSNKNDVSVIGFVNEIRQTKNGHYFLILEDLTGNISVLIRKDSENQENVRTIERTLNDQLIYVKGTYNPGEKSKNGIIYAKNVSKIDIPIDYKPNRSPDPLSIALISDTHIGSREFEESLWNRFINFLKGKVGNKNLREIAGRIKYIIINGDLVDGIGVYPNQQDDLIITDIYKQFEKASELISKIPSYIKVFYSSGNHDPVRNAIPRPAVPKKYSEELINLGVSCLGNPSLIKTHGVNTLAFHGDSMIDMNMLISDLENDKPVETMKELLKCRHLAPIYGKKTQIAPTSKDWLVIDKIPDIFHTGHLHINGIGQYRNVSLINSGCFQTQTDFMKSFGITPTPGNVPIIELDTFKSVELDLKSN
ncbi:MAG: DNA-directed DNA polymerase II small subunit [Promethearchaeota archaeon]